MFEPSGCHPQLPRRGALLATDYCLLTTSNNRPPAVDDYRLPRDVVRGVGGEEDGDAFEFARVADARDGAAGLDRRLGLLDDGVGEARVEEARGDGVDAYPAAPPRRGQLAREAEEPGLRRGVADVVRAVGRRLQARHGR